MVGRVRVMVIGREGKVERNGDEARSGRLPEGNG